MTTVFWTDPARVVERATPETPMRVDPVMGVWQDGEGLASGEPVAGQTYRWYAVYVHQKSEIGHWLASCVMTCRSRKTDDNYHQHLTTLLQQAGCLDNTQ